MAGRLTDLDVDVIQGVGQKGRLTDVDVDVIQRVGQKGRLTDLDVEVLLDDSGLIPQQIAMGPGGWGFIPIGRRVDRSVYIDTYEDEY